ncbi:putative odorant binding protein [Trypoxylus dichotomus]
MKYLVFSCIILVISLVLANERQDHIKNSLKECQDSSGVSRDSLVKRKVEDDVKLKSFLYCIFQKLNLFKSDNTADSAKIEQLLPPELTSEERNAITNECLSLTGSDGDRYQTLKLAKMKRFIIVTVLCIVVSVQALTDEQKAKVKAASAKCAKDTSVDPTLVQKGREGVFVDDPKLRAFILCFLQATEILDSNGDAQVDKVKQKLSKDITEADIDTLLAKCKPTASDPAQKAGDFWQCYWNNAPKHIQLV